MNLINEKIKHKTFGVGTVVAQDESYITIEFQAKTSKFPYPSAFEKFITPVDPAITDAIYNEVVAAKAEEEAKKAEEAARKAAEEERRLELLRQQESKKSVRKSSTPKNSYVAKRNPGQSLTYLVFQGDTYEEERKGQFIWAPKYTKAGGTCHHWDRLIEVRPGDIIFHCSNGYIRALSIVKDRCVDSARPDQTTGDWTQWEKDGRRVDCEYYVLDVPIKHGEHKNVIREYCNVKYAPFDKDGNGNMGYLFDLDRKLALYFLEVAAGDNEFLYDVPELSWMLCGVPTITTLDELRDNCEVLDSYLESRKDPEYSFALNLIRRGTCFVAIQRKGAYRFYPSRFVGYKENSMSKHENNEWKDGKETNPAIGNLLGVGTPIPNATLDLAYKDYCRKLGFEPQDKGAFGVEHKFWEIHE